MKQITQRLSIITLSMATAIALSGCGGGGTAMDSLQPAAGLTPSTATPVYATDAADTLAELLPDETRTFAPLSAGLHRQFEQDGPQGTTLSNFRVNKIRSDGNNGFHITWTDGDETNEVHMTAEDYDDGDYVKRHDDGGEYWFWSWTGSFDGTEKNSGSPQFEYFDAYAFEDFVEGRDDSRGMFVFGVRTEPANVPTGSVTYEGRFRARSWRTHDPSFNLRDQMWGGIRLAANFNLSELEGSIIQIRVWPQGSPGSAWPTSSFEITDGRIVNGQFTATLRGVDTDRDAPDDTSLRGFSGAILGEFYGPGAEELGGVLNATRDLVGEDNDRTLTGFIGGKERATSLDDEMPISAGVDRRGYSSASPSVALQDVDNRVTKIARDGAGGYRVTYTVDGVEQPEVHLEAADLFAHPTISSASYYKRNGTTGFSLNSQTGSISWIPTFNHFDVKEWYEFVFPTVESAEGGDFAQADSARFAFVVHGDRTADMPAAGQASYEGRAAAFVWNPNPGEVGGAFQVNQDLYRGDLSLTADFAAATVAGQIGNLRHSPPGRTQTNSIPGSLSIQNGQIDGNALSADLTGLGLTGTANGAFYGPDAAEVGGVLTGTHSDGGLLQGWFGGDKE